MKFGQWVYLELDSLGKSVNWLAKRVGISHSAYIDYRNTERKVTADVLFKTLRVLSDEKECSEERLLLRMARECYKVGV
jgi:transcriptional regulator with XRE-family HTH domain